KRFGNRSFLDRRRRNRSLRQRNSAMRRDCTIAVAFGFPPAAKRPIERNRRERVFAPGLVQRLRVSEVRLLRREHIEKARRAALIEFGGKAQRLTRGIQRAAQATHLIG